MRRKKKRSFGVDPNTAVRPRWRRPLPDYIPTIVKKKYHLSVHVPAGILSPYCCHPTGRPTCSTTALLAGKFVSRGAPFIDDHRCTGRALLQLPLARFRYMARRSDFKRRKILRCPGDLFLERCVMRVWFRAKVRRSRVSQLPLRIGGRPETTRFLPCSSQRTRSQHSEC